MNLRILKKLSKKAVPALHALCRYKVEPFPAPAGECIVEVTLERKHVERGRWGVPGYEHAWAGTPMVGETSPCDGEWSERTAWTQLTNEVADRTLVEVGPHDDCGCPASIEPGFPLTPINVFRWLREAGALQGETARP